MLQPTNTAITASAIRTANDEKFHHSSKTLEAPTIDYWAVTLLLCKVFGHKRHSSLAKINFKSNKYQYMVHRIRKKYTTAKIYTTIQLWLKASRETELRP